MTKKNKNGLPLEIKYCKNCNLINQRPTSINEYFHKADSLQTTVEFDEDGICAACHFVKKNLIIPYILILRQINLKNWLINQQLNLLHF